jgi:hypothetical protein
MPEQLLIRYFKNMNISTKDIAEITCTPLTSVRTLLTPKHRK